MVWCFRVRSWINPIEVVSTACQCPPANSGKWRAMATALWGPTASVVSRCRASAQAGWEFGQSRLEFLQSLLEFAQSRLELAGVAVQVLRAWGARGKEWESMDRYCRPLKFRVTLFHNVYIYDFHW